MNLHLNIFQKISQILLIINISIDNKPHLILIKIKKYFN